MMPDPWWREVALLALATLSVSAFVSTSITGLWWLAARAP